MSNTTTNPIINVTVLEASKPSEIITRIENTMSSVEGSAFKIATMVAYLTGTPIPTENGGHVQIKEKHRKKQAEVLSKVDRNKATVSRWLKAVRLIIDNELYNDFNNSVYPFSFDKVILILSNYDDGEAFEGMDFAELMDMSFDKLKDMLKSDSEEEDSEEEDSEEVEVVEPSGEDVTFVYDGKSYTVDKAVLEKFIETNCEIA